METHKKCKAEEHEGERWLPLEQFHKMGRRQGRQQYKGICKDCANARYRKQYHETNGALPRNGNNWQYKNQYIRARSRALTRLSKLVPELYEMCLREELEKEGVPRKDKSRSHST